MAVLLGPADADHFRVKVGRYGDRWYHDPLPTCPIAPATEAAWPSYSITKGASGKDWTFVGLKRVAHALEQDPTCLTGLDFGRRYDALMSINKRGLEQAGQRGTNVHHRFEAKLRGYPGLLIPDDAPGREYDIAVDQFFDQYQPELVAAEFVVIHRDLNGHGYGCTVDARLRINNKIYAVDYKSRGEDSAHGGYPEEGAQIAAGICGQYMIVDGDHGPERRRMDDVDGAIIISVRPDGCRIYPVDIDKGWSHYQSMHAWWVARLSEREVVGKPWMPKKAVEKTVDLTRDLLRSRCKAIAQRSPQGAKWLSANWPDGVPALSSDHRFTDVEYEAIDLVVCRAEDLTDAPFDTVAQPLLTPASTVVPPPAPVVVAPDEGPTVDPAPVKARYDQLDQPQRDWIGLFARQAHTAGRSIYVSELTSQRRISILDGLLVLTAHPNRDLAVDAAVGHALDLPTRDLSLLDHGAAQTFAATCHLIAAGLITVDATGVLQDAA